VVGERVRARVAGPEQHGQVRRGLGLDRRLEPSVLGRQADWALIIAESLAHLGYAVRYQEFLGGKESAERICSLGDLAAVIRTVLSSAAL
jgi:hypothetical protein